MGKNLEFISNLESQIDKISSLVSKLKEDKEDLVRHNEKLKNEIKSANRNIPVDTDTKNQEAMHSSGISETQSEDVRRMVQNALNKLNQLRQAFMEAS